MIRRPKPGEGEEELLRMQEEYLQEKSKDPNTRPAAQVTNLRWTAPSTKRHQTEAGTRKPSKYAQSKGLTNAEKRPRIEAATSSVFGDILEKNVEKPCENETAIEDDKVYFPNVLPSVLGNIVEKNVDVDVDFNISSMPSQGFPEVTKRDPTIVPGQKSIHRQHYEKQYGDSSKMEVDHKLTAIANKNIKILDNLPKKSFMISSKESIDIHNDNVKLLSSMTQNEILEEQQKLLTTLDPGIVAFIKAKRQMKSLTHAQSMNPTETPVQEMDTSASPDDQIQNELVESYQDILTRQKNIVSAPEKDRPTLETTAPDPKSTDDHLWDNDVLTHPHVNKWLHFNSLEKDKLEWMKGIEESTRIKPDEPYEARFDFTGYLLPYTVEYTEKTKTLFHHGSEPHRPGYSLTELIELTRSTITQQRVMALNTIAGILEYYNAGTYKDIIELPLSKMFFIIRIAMDENKVIVLEPALKAMRSLLYNRIDEACLDALKGFEEGTIQPWLENDKSEIEELESKESELKDFHLAEIDLIAAILRTDILQRLYYILETVRPSFNCVQYALQILTRLARDSPDTSMRIIQSEHLMRTIFKNFIPTTSINFAFDPQMIYKGKPVLAAVRLLRILAVKFDAGEAGQILIEKYGILEPISEYISSGVDGTYGLRIQIEAYCLLANLLSYRISVSALFPVVITTLYKHIQGTDISVTSSIISATHAAVIVQLINKILLYHHPADDIASYKTQIYPLLLKGMEKWIKQVSHADAYTCAHLRLLTSVIDCSTTVLLMEDVPIKLLNDSLMHLSSSQGFKAMLRNLEPSSNLLSGLENKDLHVTKNLMSLRGAVIDAAQKVLPILNVTSPLPFFASLFKLLAQINDKKIAECFLQHVTPYLKKLTNKDPGLADNWFTRMEVDFVFNVLKLATQTTVSEHSKDLFYAVANKMCFVLRIDKISEINFLFDRIVFNKFWFPADRMFKMLSLTDAELHNDQTFPLDNIRRCYERVINLNHVNLEQNVRLLAWQEPILPRDWIYMPILALYSSRHDVENAPKVVGDHAKRVEAQAAEEKKFIVSCSLEWILFNETCFPDLLNDIDVTDRFCRIMCVFLCDDSLFLDPKINGLLRKCTQILFKKNTKFNFDKELVGLHNFEDFYTEILQQFQSVSYGDATFAACVLVPLAQKHNVKWRQLIWYEYVGCLRYLDCPEDLLCYSMKEYLQPDETDRRVLESYNRALKMNFIRPNTTAYKIAVHHLENYKSRKSQVNTDTGA